MILLDTSVVSEPLRAAPAARVVEWLDAQPLETLFLSAITVAELRAGVALLPAGKRRTGLHASLETRVLPLFAGRGVASMADVTRGRFTSVTRLGDDLRIVLDPDR